MDARELQEKLRARLGWRVGDHTAKYILTKLASPRPRNFKVFAADARTGLPVYETIDPAQLAQSAQPTLF